MRFAHLVAIAEETVNAAQKTLPLKIREPALGVPVHYEAAPDPGLLDEGIEHDILGLFIGPPHGTELAQDNPQPPQIFLFINSLWDYSEKDMESFREEVRLTYLHELGHYLGWDEEQVSARGLD